MPELPSIPPRLLPADGRFGSGPSRIRPSHTRALAASPLLGTSHRQAPVKGLVSSIRRGLGDLLRAPDGYEVVLGNGGATAFWDAACASLIRERAAFAVFGAFGAKFADEARRAPHLDDPIVVEAPAGRLARLNGDEDADVFAHPHHETSTGVVSPVERLGPADALTLVDATSIAGAHRVDLAQTDAYYFSPQKALGSDGGLWIAVLSPAALDRARELSRAPGRWVPAFLDLDAAARNSLNNQTLNTPAIATLVLLDEQIRWLLGLGGIEAAAARAGAASDLVYRWAEACPLARPFVDDPALRSPVVATVEFDASVDARAIADHLRAHGIVDLGAYRGVGDNQMRIATWPSTPTEDVEALLACLDFTLAAMG
ncbi:phosphoserine transaminase [Actinomyces sp. B33]|uniref:phosphoserine transaminase n=1 Tax=Actinomyces sp. B33 TaxID=2942131 RepID=UPI00233F9531|nr:phosphoserine transaminase [Actinomyces sp. B33]MDC4232198.1 phosphoserine transaminase [Actinomyces sp. B33]